MRKKEHKGKLYIVSTHIGNREDITLRAIEVLKLCDLVICEELKEGARILREQNIHNKLETMNEQNEGEKIFKLIEMIQNGKKLALISDCGTPVFADPGYQLVRNAIAQNIEIIVVPGVSSIMAAIVRSGMPTNQFLYAGFLSRKTEERELELLALSKETRTVVLYDTPYRLLPVLEEASKSMPHRKAYIGMNLTLPYETHHYGSFVELYEKFKEQRIKAEFVICFAGATQPEALRKPESDNRRFDRNRDDGDNRRRFDRSRDDGDNRRFGRNRDDGDNRRFDRNKPEGDNRRRFDRNKPDGDNRRFGRNNPDGDNRRRFDRNKPDGDNRRRFDRNKPDGDNRRRFDRSNTRTTFNKRSDNRAKDY